MKRFSLFLLLLLSAFCLQAQWVPTNGPLKPLVTKDLVVLDSFIFANADCGPFFNVDGSNSWQQLQTYYDYYHHVFYMGEPYLYQNIQMQRLLNVSGTLTLDSINPLGTYINEMAADSSGFYAVSHYKGLSHSPNGANFISYTTGLPADTIFQSVDTFYIWQAFAIALSADHIYVGTDRGLYQSAKTAISFSPLGSALPDTVVHLVFAMDSLLLVGVGNDIFRSADAGLSWAPVSAPIHGICKQIQVLNDTIFACYPLGGLMYSSDEGLTWALANNGLRYLSAYGVAYRNGEYFVASSDGTYQGLSPWTKMEYGFSCAKIVSMTDIDSCIVAATTEGIYQSADGGANWDRKTDVLSIKPEAQIVTLNGNFLQCSMLNQAHGPLHLLVSSDCGNSWSDTAVSTIRGPIWAFTSNGTTAIVSHNGGHWRITNGGTNIIPIDSLRNVLCAIEPTLRLVDNDIYAMGCPNAPLYRSTDDGVTWANASSGLPNDYPSLVTRVGNIHFTTFRHSIYQSLNGGTYWFRSDNGMPMYYNIILAFEYDGTYYYCTNGEMVWASLDGAHWTDVSQGLPHANANRIFVPLTISGGDLYFGSEKNGIWKRPLSEITVASPPPIAPATLHLFPNPATDRIYWTSQEKVVQVQCFNTLGQAVDAPMTSDNIDVSRLPHGMYVIRATLRDGRLVSGRVLVEK